MKVCTMHCNDVSHIHSPPHHSHVEPGRSTRERNWRKLKGQKLNRRTLRTRPPARQTLRAHLWRPRNTTHLEGPHPPSMRRCPQVKHPNLTCVLDFIGFLPVQKSNRISSNTHAVLKTEPENLKEACNVLLCSSQRCHASSSGRLGCEPPLKLSAFPFVLMPKQRIWQGKLSCTVGH